MKGRKIKIGLCLLLAVGGIFGSREALEAWWLLQARQARDRGDFQEAETSFRRIVSLHPHHAVAFADWGELELRRRRWTEAEQLFKKAHRLNPSLPHLCCRLASICTQKRKIEDAQRFIDEELRRQPDCYLAHLLRSNDALRLGRYALAIQDLTFLLKTTPDDKLLLTKLADACLKASRPSEAQQCLDRLQRLEPNNPRVMYLQALRWVNFPKDTREIEQATQTFEAIADRNTGPQQVEYHWARACERLDRWDEAQRHYERALELNPDDSKSCYNLAQMLTQRGKPIEANRWLIRFRKMEQRKREREELSRRLARRPKSPGPRLDIAEWYISQGRWREAELQLKEAVRLAPNDVAVREWAAKFHRRRAAARDSPG